MYVWDLKSTSIFGMRRHLYTRRGRGRWRERGIVMAMGNVDVG